MSVDPLVSITDQPYAFTSADPVNLTDPNGFDSEEFLGQEEFGVEDLPFERLTEDERDAQIQRDLNSQEGAFQIFERRLISCNRNSFNTPMSSGLRVTHARRRLQNSKTR